MNLREKAVKGVIWNAIQGWGSQAISFIVFLVLARLLQPEAFGLVAMASVFLAFMQVFLDQGFSQAIIQRQDLEPEHLDTAFWTNASIGVLLTAISYAAAGLMATLFREPLLTPVLHWLSLNFLFGSLNSVQTAILSRELSFKLLATRSLIATLAGGVCGVTMAFLNLGVWSLVGQQLASTIVGVLVLWSSTQWRPKLKYSRKHFRELFTFGINVVGFNVLNFLNRRSDDFLIGYFLGTTALGYYTVAYRILLIVTQLLIGTVHKTSMPVFSRLQQEPERLRQAFYRAIQMTCLLSYPVFVILTTMAPEIIVTFFGKQWIQSVPVMQVLCLIGFLQAGFYYNGAIIMALGKPDWNLWLNCIQATLNVTAFYIAVRWGIVAVAIAYVVRGYLMSPLPLLFIRRLIHTKFTTYFRQYFAPACGALAMALTIVGVRYLLSSLTGFYLLVPCVVIGFLVYGVTIFLIAPQLLREVLTLVKGVLPKSARI
jgi:PST family polysaccharide transporter